jgi:hypothetical protein
MSLMNRKTQRTETRADLIIQVVRKMKGWRLLLVPGVLIIFAFGWLLVWTGD